MVERGERRVGPAVDDGGKLTRIRVTGFKSIEVLDLELRDLNVLIGPNGAGKSNFVSLFRFMNMLVRKDLQFLIRQRGGAEKVLFFGSKVANRLSIDLIFPQSTYKCILFPTVSGGFVFEHEECSGFGHNILYPGPLKWFGKKGSEESDLPLQTGLLEGHDIGGWTARQILDWKVYHFHDTGETAKVKKTGRTADMDRLRPDASNLAAHLRYLRLKHPDEYADIVATVRRVAPFLHDFILEPEAENAEYIRLKWKHVGTDDYFDANDLSDGTLRFICLATLFLQPNPPTTIIVDEPELGLHPYAVHLLAGLIRSAAARTQVIVATQSVTLANQFGWEDIIVVDRKDNASVFRRLREDEVKVWLDDYQMGDIWEKNLIGGTP